ncbi:NADPH-dependent FMN reductase [Streptomyces chiangmaiensis]|uniref:NAD(P)H-dependent oxidoreductase n=1 Tax=Streptomyces chiangmaiensis TaxID=766497 RepID=A0ABU7FJ71_9ACTN|nr:NAD(P)H-dependent oxidoreductase [Streptomyces chiangmaiensis]MED7824175.1 NAD(P)H-dependent oxidoreductase [Streptomyces chiangmaiensis]
MSHAAPLRVAIIAGSTRPGRKADTVARWIHSLAERRDDAVFEVVDLADHGLPLIDEPVPPMAGMYNKPHTQKWAATIASFDAFVFVTPEYNHSTSGALKNAIDYLFAEWNDKVAGFVSYGFNSGFRAVEHLRLVLSELKVATVRSSVALTIGEDFTGQTYTEFTPRDTHETYVTAMLDEVVTWGTALRTVRQG